MGCRKITLNPNSTHLEPRELLLGLLLQHLQPRPPRLTALQEARDRPELLLDRPDGLTLDLDALLELADLRLEGRGSLLTLCCLLLELERLIEEGEGETRIRVR